MKGQQAVSVVGKSRAQKDGGGVTEKGMLAEKAVQTLPTQNIIFELAASAIPRGFFF